ncbi:MAG: bifunctional oligoribonuclease/PAP phosphatase NrnA [Clostridia bacterium]|nr:bifunctional oligoribonuclease/PAP phosphatase NrnA [Clostridia bacterium]
MFKNAYDMIQKAKNIAIFVHINLDGDAIGSARAMQLYLQSIGKTADIFSNDEIDEYFAFLNVENKLDKTNINYDLSLVLDCSDIKRIGRCAIQFYKSKNSICIDHHTDYTRFTQVSINVPSASSTGILVYQFLKTYNVKLTDGMCEALYTAIASDTGAFIHSNTTYLEHQAVADMMKNSNVDFGELNFHLFKSKSLSSVMVLKKALENMKFYCNNELLVTYITKQNLLECNAKEEDTSSISGFVNGIENIKCAIILMEKDTQEYRVSIRSKGEYARLVATRFGGGGHPQAAGCRVYGELEKEIEHLVGVAKEVLC